MAQQVRRESRLQLDLRGLVKGNGMLVSLLCLLAFIRSILAPHRRTQSHLVAQAATAHMLRHLLTRRLTMHGSLSCAYSEVGAADLARTAYIRISDT
jgi:hypothetical protein